MTRINMFVILIVILRVITAAPLPQSLGTILEIREGDPLEGCCGIGNDFHPPACTDCHIPGIVGFP